MRKKQQSYSRAAKALDLIQINAVPYSRTRPPLKVLKKKPKLFESFNSTGRQKLSPFLLFHTKDVTKKVSYDSRLDANHPQSPRYSVPKQVHQRLISQKPHMQHLRFRKPQPHQPCEWELKELNQFGKNLSKTFDLSRIGNHDTVYKTYHKRSTVDGTQSTFASQIQAFKASLKKDVKPSKSNSHSFDSYTDRHFLQIPQENNPSFDYLRVDFGKLRPRWNLNSNLNFKNFRNKIRTKLDREDQNWFTRITHDHTTAVIDPQNLNGKISQLERKPNLTPSLYPFRASLYMQQPEVIHRQRQLLNI